MGKEINISLSDRKYMVRFEWPDHLHLQSSDECYIPDDDGNAGVIVNAFEVFGSVSFLQPPSQLK